MDEVAPEGQGLAYTGVFADEAAIRAFETVPFETRFPFRSVYSALCATSFRNPDKVAIRFLPNGLPDDIPLETTFRELLRDVTRLANLLRAFGIKPGDCVALVLPNLPEFHALTWAAATAGIVFPINCYLESRKIADLIRGSRAQIVISPGVDRDPEIYNRVAESLDEVGHPIRHLCVGEGAKNEPDVWQLRLRHMADVLAFELNENGRRVAAYVHTGGTTGQPKIAMQTMRNLLFEAWILGAIRENQSHGCTACGGPMFHVAGLVVTSLVPVVWGNTVLMLSSRGYRAPGVVARLWETAARHGVTQLTMVPTIVSVLADLPFEPVPPGLRAVGCGAAKLPLTVEQRFSERTGLPIRQGYGMTEAGCAVTTSLHSPVPAGSIGRRLPYIRVRIVKTDRKGRIEREARVGEQGLVLVSGPNVFAGYLRSQFNPWEDGHWLNTGDLGYRDAADCFWLTGREKDSINRGGHNIDPGMVEEALLSVAGVQDAAVVALPDAYAGELPLAYVSLACGTLPDGEAVLAAAAPKIPERAAIPKRLIVLPELPKTDVGKVDKFSLRKMAAELAVTEALIALGLRYDDFEISTPVGSGAPMSIAFGSSVSEDQKTAAIEAVDTLGVPVSLVHSA